MNLSFAIMELSIILKFEQPTQGHGTSDVQSVCENTLAEQQHLIENLT